MNDEAPIGKVYDARLIKRLLRYLRPYRGLVAASVLFLLIHSLLGVAGPYLTKVAIDHSLDPQPGSTSWLDPVLPADRWDSLQVLVLIYLGVQLLCFVFRALQIKLMNYTGQRVMFDIRAEIFSHLQRMGVRYYDGNPVGRLVTRVSTDVDMLNELFTSGVVAIAGDLITLLCIVAVMVQLSPALTLVMFAVGPLVLAATMWFRKQARQSYREVRLAIAKINSFLQEHFSGIAVVQIFNNEGRSWDEFNNVNGEHRDAQYLAIQAHAYFLPLVEWFGVLGLAALLVYGGYMVGQGLLSLGVIVAFMQYGARVFKPLQDLSDKYNILQSAMASSERIFGLLDMTTDEQHAEVAAAPGSTRLIPASSPSAVINTPSPRVEFKNVWFAYKDEHWVLRDVSFAVEPGEMVAIVGHTGAGKTTLISLLLRFYEVQKGSILVGARDVREWPIQELRRQFGIVLQDPYLFSGTIESNIRLRNSSVSGERLRQVIREVNLESYIDSLPHGIHEPLRERGSSLSSGQKQLLSFARALAYNPHFLILDEATSSVDTETEFKIREALSRMLAGHTSIVIAHRLSTIQKASRIIVMHKGEVRESGTHQELLAQRGVYYKLYQLQYQDQEAQPGVETAALSNAADVEPDLERAHLPVAPEMVLPQESLASVSLPVSGSGFNGAEQPEPEETVSPAPESSDIPGSESPRIHKRWGKDRSSGNAHNGAADGQDGAHLSLSLDTNGDSAPSQDASEATDTAKAPVSSPTSQASSPGSIPPAGSRRRRGKRRR